MLKSEMQDHIELIEKKNVDQAVTILNLRNKIKALEWRLSKVKELSVNMCVVLQED